jgi:hypothetical protein
MVPCIHRDHSVPDLEGHCHEIVIKFCRAISRRYSVNCIAVLPERSGNVANRNKLCLPTSHRYRRRAEAGGRAICAEAGGKYRGISPDIINRIVNRSNAIGRAGFSIGQDCQAGESQQQLQRGLRNKFQIRQCPLGWM